MIVSSEGRLFIKRSALIDEKIRKRFDSATPEKLDPRTERIHGKCRIRGTQAKGAPV